MPESILAGNVFHEAMRSAEVRERAANCRKRYRERHPERSRAQTKAAYEKFKASGKVSNCGVSGAGIAHTILLVAKKFREPFSLEDLAVACWEHNQQLFGLRGHEDRHLNLVRVVSCVCGKRRGLVACGKLERVSRGLYQLGKVRK